MRIPRRIFCLATPFWAVAGLAQNPGGGSNSNAAVCGDLRYRIRAEALDDLLQSAKTSVAQKKLAASEFSAIVEWLYHLQEKLYDEARAHQFSDITEGTYWQRSRLKFPSVIDLEREALQASRR